MTPPRSRRSSLETNTAPDALVEDSRRTGGRDAPPDSMPPRDDADEALIPAGGGLTPAEDGDADQPAKKAAPGDYEWEIRRLDAAAHRD
jgi:hypothetical protein